MRISMAILAAGAALSLTVPASAAYYMKLGDIKGESSATADKGHKDWIELSSLQFQGGVNVAVGDVNGDGTADSKAPRDAASGMASGKRQHKPMTVTKEVDKSSPKLAEAVASGKSSAAPRSATGTIKANDPEPQAIGLLLPAVQKVREASARLPAGATCRVGQQYESAQIRDGEDGAVHEISDVTVTACQGESFSLNFTKIKF